MLGLVAIILSILALYGFLYLRYLRIRANMTQTLTGNVQYSVRRAPSGEPEPFLPGSLLRDRMKDLGKELDDLEVKAEVSPKSRSRKDRRRGVIRSRADIRRSYIVDALLERPKF